VIITGAGILLAVGAIFLLLPSSSGGGFLLLVWLAVMAPAVMESIKVSRQIRRGR
jgi:hypothetical protein